MGNKELRSLKRRDLLQMLLTQCEETERLQQETDEMKTQLETLTESYERLKVKLNIKDERLNEKDGRIAELEGRIEEMQESRVIELEEAGSIAEAAIRINGVFEAAQQAAEQYLMNVRRIAGNMVSSVEGSQEKGKKTEEQAIVSGKISEQKEPAVSEAGTAQKLIPTAKAIPERGWLSVEEALTEQSQISAVAVSKATTSGTAMYGTLGCRDPHETGWMAGIRKKQPRTRQIIPMNVNQDDSSISGDVHVR